MKWTSITAGFLLLLFAGPVAVAIGGETQLAANWRTASRESAKIAPDPQKHPNAVIQIYAARAFSWRGYFAVHTWIAVKANNAAQFTTYEVMGWHVRRGGSALQVRGGIPDRYWFGARPELLVDLRGDKAARLIGDVQKAVASYPHAGSYTVWPGPNSNTFTAHVARQVPDLALDLPPTAIGKDYIPGGAFIGTAPSGSGAQVSLAGLLGVLVSMEEGIEINILGLSFGIDFRDLALRLPGIGKVGL
jgi:hypothetical protein